MNLYLGDCLEVMKQIPDQSVDMVLADPPYGTTACKWDTVIPFEPMWFELWRIAKPAAAMAFFCNQPFSANLISSNYKDFKYSWVWDKVNGIRNHLNAKRQPMRKTEEIAVFYRESPTYIPKMRDGGYRSRKTQPGQSAGFGKVIGTDSGREVTSLYPVNLISFPSHNPNKSVHPTQKPTALLEYLIFTYTRPGETVLDFCMGSGSTGVAAKNAGREFIGIEKDPEYFRIAQQRINAASFISLEDQRVGRRSAEVE